MIHFSRRHYDLDVLRNRVLALLIIIYLSFALSVRAEYFRHLTLDDGLSHLSVMSISQDKIGRIWLGTREGINIYDGMSIHSFKGFVENPDDSGKKVWIGNFVHGIYPDSVGDMFLHIDNDIIRFDLCKDRFSRFTHSGNVKAVAGHSGSLYFIVGDSLMVKPAGGGRVSYLFPMHLPPDNNHLSADASSFYVSNDLGLHIYDRKTGTERTLMRGEPVQSTLVGSDGTLWISAKYGGLYRLRHGEQTPQQVSLPSVGWKAAGSIQSRNAIEDLEGKIWYGSFTGIFCYDPATGQTVHVEIPANVGVLAHSSIFGMFCDRAGNIWVGTYYGGANYFTPRNELFVNFNYRKDIHRGLNTSFVIDMAVDRDGRLWFGADGSGVTCVDPKWNILKRLSTINGDVALRQDNIKTMVIDSLTNKLYIGTHMGGLSIYDIDSNRITNLIDNPGLRNNPGNVIHDLKIFGRNLYITSRSGILRMNLDTGDLAHIDSPQSPYKLDLDLQGNIYVINYDGNAIYRIKNPENPASHCELFADFRHEPSIMSAISCTAKGLYVGTKGSGILFFPGYGSKWTAVDPKGEKISDSYCYNLTRDCKGNLYCLTQNHIVKIDAAGKIEQIAFSNYFPDSHIVSECALRVLDNGEILIGSTMGITRMNRNIFQSDGDMDGTEKIFFSALKVNGRNVVPDSPDGILECALPLASAITLPHNENSFTIDLGLLGYNVSSGCPIIEYKLDGIDDNWQSTDKGEIRYTSLPPGSYLLHARIQGSDKEISLDVNVSRAWYDTWWAWLIYFVVVAATTWLVVHKVRSARRLKSSLRKEQEEKERIEEVTREKLVFFTNVSHEFQTPLTLIMSHVDLMLAKYNGNAELTAELSRIRRHSKQLSGLITQLLEFRKFSQNYQKMHVGRHNASMLLLGAALPFVDHAAKRCITFSVDTPDTDACGYYDADLMKKVIVNLISNAFKYSPDGSRIECSVATDSEGRLVFRVSDTGKGISESDLPYIFDRYYNGDSKSHLDDAPGSHTTGIGLAYAKSIIESHHGEVSVVSSPERGSTFTVIIPATKEAYDGDSKVVFDSDEIEETGNLTDLESPPDAPETAAVVGLSDDEKRAAEAACGKPLILIVEDNNELRHNLERIFARLYRTETAANGAEGLEKAQECNPDIIVSDVMMPVMSGTQMCLNIKSDVQLCHIPVVLLTALDAPQSKLEGFQANADEYITKPFDTALLIERIQNLLRNRRLLQESLQHKPLSQIDLSGVVSIDRDLLKRTTAIIDKHIADMDLDIAFICRELGLSRTVFFNKFKSLAGMTPNNFIMNHRLKFAATLLKTQPQLNVAEVSDMAGFSGTDYFRRCFKKQFGVSPQQYKSTREM